MANRPNEFKPNWQLDEIGTLAVNLTLALYAHIPDWPGATDEQLEAVARDLLEGMKRDG